MSLYQEVHIRDKDEPPYNLNDEDAPEHEAIAAWYNIYELDDWMKKLRERKGVHPTWVLDLTLEDIDKLEADVPNVNTDVIDQYKTTNVPFCTKAREALKEDKIVFYNG